MRTSVNATATNTRDMPCHQHPEPRDSSRADSRVRETTKPTKITMPRFLGIDHGSKRIGLAVSDPGATLASPLTTIDAATNFSDQVAAILSYAKEFEIDAFVIGLPLNMDDTEGNQAKTVRRFGAELLRISGKPVHYWDERLSSHAAEDLLRPAELTRKKRKARLDRVAAQIMLQEFLDSEA